MNKIYIKREKKRGRREREREREREKWRDIYVSIFFLIDREGRGERSRGV